MRSLIMLSGIYVAALIIAVLVYYFLPYGHPPPTFHEYYSDHLRGELFTAFLSLGAFIFALKTFLIVTMKKELYDHPRYKQTVDDNKAIGGNVTQYGPLNKLRIFLSWTMLFALIASIAQISIGLIPHWMPSLLCLALALYAMVLLTVSIVLMWKNLADLLEHWENGDCDS